LTSTGDFILFGPTVIGPFLPRWFKFIITQMTQYVNTKCLYNLKLPRYADFKMGKKIVIDVDRITEPEATKSTLLNLRIEKDLYDAFSELCESEFKQPASKIIRSFIRELCIQNGKLKKR